jgi:hypothetical protein
MTSVEPLNADPEVISARDIVNEENPVHEEKTSGNVSPTEGTEDSEKPFTITKGSTRYVISINERPRFYVRTKDQAVAKIERIAEYLTDAHPDYNFYLNQVTENVWQMTRSYRWFLISYEEVYRTIRYDKVVDIVFAERMEDSEQSEEKKTKKSKDE